MKKTEITKTTSLIVCTVIILGLIIYIFIIKEFVNKDNDYKKLGLEIKESNIEYSTIYDYDKLYKYKVYKIKNYYNNMEKFKKQLEDNEDWSKNKFYEYIMSKFCEIKDDENIKIDRENLYYYHKNGAYAIFDLKNAKLYYFENSIWNNHKEYSNILGIETKKYNAREIYSVRGGPQNDGLDYYVYEFSKERGQDIVKNLDNDSKWSKDKLEDKILNNYTYNKEILEIKNGYYHYELVCRTRDEDKKKNVTKENATGCEIGVYDADKNILYYYWQSI